MKGGDTVVKAAGIGNDAVRSKTGKTWPEWFALLDSVRASTMEHKEIVAYLGEHHGIAPWWRQMVAVDDLFRAWNNDDIRARWLPDADITIRKATPGKSLRITWTDGITHVDVNLYSKGDRKSQVTVQHTKLSEKHDLSRRKTYWSEALQQLKDLLESGE
ncbi:MAG: DUF4287 domain-containing protein [Fidelibacterota bacterium]